MIRLGAGCAAPVSRTDAGAFFKSLERANEMNEKAKGFIKHVDKLYAVAARVGTHEVCLQAGTLVVVVRHAVPELRSAWNQFVFSICTDEDHVRNHLQYFYSVVRNMRGHDAVSLIELSADVAFAVDVSVAAQTVDLVA